MMGLIKKDFLQINKEQNKYPSGKISRSFSELETQIEKQKRKQKSYLNTVDP